MEDTILNLSIIAQNISAAAFAFVAFLGYIWVFVKLTALRKKSKRFLANSKKENFEGGLKLVRKTRSLFALAMLLDICIAYVLLSDGQFIRNISLLGASGAVLFAVLLALMAAHLVYGIPALRLGKMAEKLFKNMYPSVPKLEVPEKPDLYSEPQKGEDDFFEVAETKRQTAASAPDSAQKETASENKDEEVIEYDDEGYIGAWRPPKSDTGITEEKEREEEAKKKECPFCGTLNGINNGACDFCGADISEQGE